MSDVDASSPRRFRRLRTVLRWVGRAVLVLVLGIVGVLVTYRDAFGASAEGARLAEMQASPQWDGDGFENPEPLWNGFSFGWFIEKSFAEGPPQAPEDALPVRDPRPALAAPRGLQITWLGHSTSVVQIEGATFLLDPVWGPAASPVPWLGPARWSEPVIPLDELPELDAVIISHDHYDHLDMPTVKALDTRDVPFYAPLGVGAHLARWGVPESRIVELDWWDRREVAGIELVCTPSRHASGRELLDQNATLWAGWAFLGDAKRLFFSGDTGLFDGMKRIGEELGPFDVTMVEVGAYDAAWPDWHLGPEQAVQAHGWLRGDVMLPVHWGLFDLAFHGWTEPMERVLAAAEATGTRVVTPRIGETVDADAPRPPERWWPENAWQTAEEAPVIATAVDGRPARE
ncbi:MAG: MBL fold metallo-hydrolase [Myxococcota bacterium]